MLLAIFGVGVPPLGEQIEVLVVDVLEHAYDEAGADEILDKNLGNGLSPKLKLVLEVEVVDVGLETISN